MANIGIGNKATFKGVTAGNMIARELVKADSLAQGIFTVRENVKGAGVLRTFSFDEGDLQSGATCGFSAQGGGVNNKTLTLKPLKANVEACKADFNATWEYADMENGQSGALKQEAIDAITSEILSAVSIRVEKDIWSGIETEAAKDADVVKVDISALTVDNILDEVGKVYTALASIPGFNLNTAFIALSNADKALYEQALAKAGAMPSFYLGEKGTNYLGVRVIASVGVPKDKIYASSVDNMFYLTDLDSDRNEVSVIDMDQTDLSGNIRFKALWASAASFAFGSRFVRGAVKP